MKKNTVLFFVFVFCLSFSFAQSKNEVAVQNNIDLLKQAMVNADSLSLDKLTASTLSYGHSSGHVDTKQQFIAKIVSGKSDFVSIDLTEQTINISKDIAVVRHKLNGVTKDNGKPGEAHLWVLLIWQKQQGKWKLLARQAVKQQ